MPSSSPGCIFCAIVRREVPASIVGEDETTLAFIDTKPINPGHLLVITKDHAELLAEVPIATGARMFSMAAKLAEALRGSGLRCEGVNLFLADGEAAGQEVSHVHLHVIPRFTGDGFGHRFPSSYGVRPARDDLERIAATIRSASKK